MNVDESQGIGEFLELAWSQIGKSPCDLDMPDVINHADARFSWSKIRVKLIADIQQNRDITNIVEVIDLPKDQLSVRPLARLDLDSRLAYEASVYALARGIDRALPSHVFSYRLNTWRGFFRNPVKAWVNMRRCARRIQKGNSDLLLACTDVASFYENIDVDQLARDLKTTPGPYWAQLYTEQFLRRFNTSANARGLPQGTNASALLANLYLLQIDDLLARKELRYVRYSDDFYIFGENFLQLRDALLSMTTTLRSRNLSMSRPKTRIYEPGAFKEWDEDLKKDALAYDTQLAARSSRAIAKRTSRTKIHTEFDHAIQDFIDSRTLKFCLTQMARLKDKHAVDWTLNNFSAVPHLAKEILRYLGSFISESRRMHTRLVELLSGSELAAYPYAQQHIIIFLMHGDWSSKMAVDAAWKLLQDRNTAGFVREMAARYLGRFAPAAGAGNLLRTFRDEVDPRVRRALLVACYESKQLPQELLSFHAQGEDDLIKRTAIYLLSSPQDIPLPPSR